MNKRSFPSKLLATTAILSFCVIGLIAILAGTAVSQDTPIAQTISTIPTAQTTTTAQSAQNAQAHPAMAMPAGNGAGTTPDPHAQHRITQAEREAAADRAKVMGAGTNPVSNLSNPDAITAELDPLGVPDYFGTTPNYALSPLPKTQGLGSPRDYYSAWYDDLYMQNWVLMANPTGATLHLNFALTIAGNTKTLPDTFGQGAGTVPGARTLTYEESGLIGGPVKATSLTGGQAIVSQRSLRGNSIEEVLTSESTRLSDHFYWPWYDEQSPGYQNWVIVDNPSATETVHVVIAYLDSATALPVTLGESDITPGGTWTPHFPGKMVGPIELKAYLSTGTWATDPRPVIASQRVLSYYGNAFNEFPGIPANELTTDYLWTWYDMQSPGFQNWVLIANPDLINAVDYEIKIAGNTVETGSLPAGGIVTPIFNGTKDGPVEVISTPTGSGDGKVIATQRIVAGPSFGEVVGYPSSALTSDYQWTWYDMLSSGSVNWVMIANPGATDVTYDISIAGASVESGTITAGGYVIPAFPGGLGGPVQVTTSGPVVASQRVLWNGYFNEVLGVGDISPAIVVPDTGIRKFEDELPGLTEENENDLGQYIPVAIPDTETYPDADYYEISLVSYTEQMHSDLPPTQLQGYVQTNTEDPSVSTPHYLGPMIIAQRDRPVRIKFTNELPTGSGGALFLPVDESVMGAGSYNIDDPENPGEFLTGIFTQNRASLHLHGGATPWISDGTPHQWITPAGESTNYPVGMSMENVPDMWFDPTTHEPVSEGTPGATNDPGPGSQTLYYTNDQSSRLMWYHDHAYGLTRVNVYAGEAAGYLLEDDVEQQLVADDIIPEDQIPLTVQDKTYVPEEDQLEAQDPTWDQPNWGGEGNLWFPHVYMPAQNPADPGGMNAMGRWHYGPWFFPPTLGIANPPIPNPLFDCGTGGECTRPWEPATMPGTPNPSIAAEAFMDTPVVNGTPYPTLNVDPKAYRLRILNASNDRFWNLQFYKADTVALTGDGRHDTEVKMVPAVTTPGFPETWPIDDREGGVPDPAMAGPDFIQIGNESGFLPAPAVIPSQPVDWNLDPTTFNFGNVSSHALLLGTAERADVIVDFSQYAGETLILYNDAPAAFPARDPRYDYYTGAPDLTDTGGAPTPLSGYGPNTRTMMQIKVADTTPAPAFDITALNAAFETQGATPGAFAESQDPILVPQAEYNSAYDANYPTTNYARIFDSQMTFLPAGSATPLTIPFEKKAIQDEQGEAFDSYGRMSANLGLQLPFTPGGTDFVLQGYIDGPTEGIQTSATPMAPAAGDGTQIWKITQNGVDTHTIHVHLFSVQLLNRVAWDGSVSMPDANELGWKETVRVNPLEDTIVALRPVVPDLPFEVPGSSRPMDVTQPIGSSSGFRQIDPYSGMPTTVTNQVVNYGWEYVWHCHLLGHEENDMMRPMRLSVNPPAAPSTLTANEAVPGTVTLDWVNNATVPAATTFVIERSTSSDFRLNRSSFSVAAPTVTYNDTTIGPEAATYYYRVRAENATGFSNWSNTAILVT